MIKILSISDVITNSSSEVFILTSKKKSKDLKNDIINLKDEGCSGMGGVLDIGDWTVFYISEAANIWRIIEAIKSGYWEDRINDIDDDLTWEDVSEYYEKYSGLVDKEFSYTVEDWMKENNLTKENVENLLYLHSDHAKKDVRDYIEDFCEILGGDYYGMAEENFPYPGEAYRLFNSEYAKPLIKENLNFANYIINQIKSSGFNTFMKYSKYENTKRI